ncbi:cytochrome c biogenesis protein ResB [Candidatus Poribacteria bacterium]|nr:cytochrome c biogenesis protein ResB [Candidatus Poribacteria bacterium]
MEKAISKERASGRGRLYRTMVSVETSLVFLALFAFLFFVGTVFPQSTEPDSLDAYREAGGKLAWLVGGLRLLDLFHSWYFALIAAVFALHLFLCSLHRLGVLRRRHVFRLFTREDLLQRDHSFSVACATEASPANMEKTLRRIGFRRIRYFSEDAHVKRVVSERGLPYRWISWLYHVCILLALGGFCVSYLCAFEGDLTIPVGGKKSVALRSLSTKWSHLLNLLGLRPDARARHVEIELERFITEYTQKPTLQYPDEPAERLSTAWGLNHAPIAYWLTADSFYPRDWFSILKVYENGKLIRKKKIEVNDPLRYGGLTFYQAAYDYAFDLQVGDDTLLGIQAETPFMIPQMEGEFRLKTPRLGSLFRRDGSIQILLPSAKLQHRPPEDAPDRSPDSPPAGNSARPWNTVAELSLGTTTEAMHMNMRLDNLRESSVLSYRYDPAVPVLWLATTLLMVAMAVRIYLPWYQVRCHADNTTGRTVITVSLRLVGLFTRPEILKRKLCDAFRE